MRFFICITILYVGEVFFQYLGIVPDAGSLENMLGYKVEVVFITAIALTFIQDVVSLFK